MAWSIDGKLACFVGYTSVGPAGVIYFYEPAGDVWTKATMAGGGDIYSYPMKTVTYCPNSWDGPKFFVAGGTGGAGYVYWVAGPGADVQYSSSSMFNGVEVWDSVCNPAIDSMGAIYVCGNTGSDVRVVEIILSSGGFNMKTSMGVTGSYWRGIEVDPVSNDLYMVGNNAGGSLYHRYRWSDMMTFPLTFPYGTTVSDIIFDSHHTPNRMIAVCEYQDVGDVTSVYQITKGADSYDVFTPIGQSPDYTYFEALDIDSDGHAVLVGMNDEITNEGDVWDLWDDGSGYTHLIERSDSSATFVGHEFWGVAIRPTGVQMALVAGSAVQYLYTSVIWPRQVDTGVPHFNFIDLYPASGTIANSVLNSQVDVDIGDSSTVYTLAAEVYDPLGVGRMTEVEAWLWFDTGAMGLDLPGLMGASFDNPGGENVRMHFTIDTTNTVTQLYPPPAVDEETSQMTGTWNVINATSAFVRINFSPHQQVRWAAGNPGFVQAAGVRYGGMVPEGQSTVTALDSSNSWDIKVNVTDDAPTPNEASAFDEFGFNKHTYLGASGLPNGGAVYGSGAPGTNDVVMGISGQNVTFSANCLYALSVQLMGDLDGVSGPDTIFGTAISVQGGVAGESAFGVGGGVVTLLGPGDAPLDSESVTTTT